MRSDQTSHGLRAELDQLRDHGQDLARQLTDVAVQLQNPGCPPSRDLADALAAYAFRYQRLIATLGLGPGEPALADLSRIVESRDCRQFAEQVASQLAQLIHVDIRDFAPLDLCQHEATRLCTLASEADGRTEIPELQLLRQHRHPLNALLRLCDEGQQLSDADWNECHDDVVATYGRQLATALTRGRIQRRPATMNAVPAPVAAQAPVPAPTSPVTARLDDTVIPRPVPAPEPASDLVFEPTNVSVFDESPTPQTSTVKLTGRERTAVLPTAVVSNPSTPRRPELPQGVPLPRRSDGTPAWIQQLLLSDRLPLAQHLVRCAESRQGRGQAPPSWLLRAVVLGRHLSYSKGEIARQLDEDLREFHPEQLVDGNSEQQLALSFYLRAAALPATLLAGSTVAAGILRSFRIAPGFSQLYNYCSRIALYGDRLASNLVELVRPAGESVDPAELAQLAQSATDWLDQTARRVSNYVRTSPLFLHAHWTLMSGTAIRHAEATALWCKWQETLLLASRLLRPVRGRSDADRNWVRNEVSRLTSQIRVEPLDLGRPTGGAPSPVRGIVLPSEEMHAVILEAVAIANRWLRLNPIQSARAAAPIPVETLELRDEILQRSEAVLAELQQHDRTAPGPLKAAIAACRAAVCQIQAIFEGRHPLPLVESDPRHILNADLLRIPTLELNSQWLPVADPATVERELLASLEGPTLSWRECYHLHAQAGHHDATGRLIEIDIWQSPEERDQLRDLRQSQLTEARSNLAAELDELMAAVESVPRSESWSDEDRSAIAGRLERLRHESGRMQNFAACRRQLDQLHAAILRLRSPLATAPFESDMESSTRRQLASVTVAAPPAYDIFSGE